MDAKDRSRVQRSPCPIPEPVPASTEDHPQQRPAVQAVPPGHPLACRETREWPGLLDVKLDKEPDAQNRGPVAANTDSWAAA